MSAERRLADPVGSGDREDAARVDAGVDAAQHGRPRHPRDVEVDGVEQRMPRTARRRWRVPGHLLGQPHAGGAQFGGTRPEHLVGVPVGEEPARRAEHDDAVDDRQPHRHAMLDHDQRRAGLVAPTRATASRTSCTPAGSRFAVGSSSRMRPGRIASTPASASRCRWPPESAAVA